MYLFVSVWAYTCHREGAEVNNLRESVLPSAMGVPGIGIELRHASLSHLAGPAPESRAPNDRPAPRSPAVVFVCFDRGFEAGVLRVESLLSMR